MAHEVHQANILKFIFIGWVSFGGFDYSESHKILNPPQKKTFLIKKISNKTF
jgi:hypothetical protein